MITEVITLPADDGDVLGTANSVLGSAPEDGQYEIWGASDQADGNLTVIVGGSLVAEAVNMKVQTVGQLDMAQTPLLSFFVDGGARVIINYNEVTGGTATVAVRFKTALDLLAEGINLAAIAG